MLGVRACWLLWARWLGARCRSHRLRRPPPRAVAANGKALKAFQSAQSKDCKITAAPVINGKLVGAVITTADLRITAFQRSQLGHPEFGNWLNLAVTVTKPLTVQPAGLLGSTYKVMSAAELKKKKAKKGKKGVKAAAADQVTAVLSFSPL